MFNRSMPVRRLGLTLAALIVGFSGSALAAPMRQDHVSLTTDVNVPLYYWSDSEARTRGIVLAIHGVTLYARRFNKVANELASNGYPVYAMDIRGFGSWQTENEKFGGDNKIHYTQSENDLTALLIALRRLYPDKRIFVMGESLGANLAVRLASTRPELIDGIILASPCVKRIWRINPRVALDTGKGLMRPWKEFSLTPHIEPYLSEDKRVTEEYLNDPEINKELTPADLIKSVKTNTLALKLIDKMPQDMPVLVIAGKKDKIYKARAIPKFMKQLPTRDKTVHILDDAGHLLLEHDFVQPQVMAKIENWLSVQEKRKLKEGAIAENDPKSRPDFAAPSTGGGGTNSQLIPKTR